MLVVVKVCYKVAKFPSHRRVSVQQLQSNYQAPELLPVLKDFLSSHATQDKLVLPVETDHFDVFNHLYVESRPSVVTGHGAGWQKIRAKLKVAAHGCKAKSPARFLILCLCGTKDVSQAIVLGLMVCTHSSTLSVR